MIQRMRPWRIGVLAALLALIVRLSVPIGFMPVAGGAALIPCPSQMAPPVMTMPAMHGMQHGKATDHDHQAPHQACPFAGVAAVADIAAPIVPVLLPPMPVALAALPPLSLAPGVGLAAPPPPKTGPPALR